MLSEKFWKNNGYLIYYEKLRKLLLERIRECVILNESEGGNWNMTRTEFLEQLRHALQGNVSEQVVQDNVAYYNQYISEEVQKGKREEDVLQMLGDPWILARTIIDASDGTDQEVVYESGKSSYYSDSDRDDSYGRQNVHVFGIDTWWKKLLLILFIVMIVVLVVAIVSGIVSFLAPVLVPLLIVMIIVRLIGGRRS